MHVLYIQSGPEGDNIQWEASAVSQPIIHLTDSISTNGVS